MSGESVVNSHVFMEARCIKYCKYQHIWKPVAESVVNNCQQIWKSGAESAANNYFTCSLYRAAQRFGDKAGAPDGWTGSEVAALTPSVHRRIASHFALIRSAGLVPTPWRTPRQAHIPKPGKGFRGCDGAAEQALAPGGPR